MEGRNEKEELTGIGKEGRTQGHTQGEKHGYYIYYVETELEMEQNRQEKLVSLVSCRDSDRHLTSFFYFTWFNSSFIRCR